MVEPERPTVERDVLLLVPGIICPERESRTRPELSIIRVLELLLAFLVL